MSNIAKTEELIKIDEVNNKLADFAVKNTERYYRLAYSFVKNEDAAVDSVCEAVYFSLYNARKMKEIPPEMDNWFLQLVLKSAMREMRRNNKEREFTDNSQIYAYMETLEHSMTNIFKLYYFENMAIKDIVEVIGLQEKQIMKKLKNVIDKLGISEDLDEKSEKKLREMIEVYEQVKIPESMYLKLRETIEKERQAYEKDMNKRIKNSKRKPLGVLALALGIFFLTILLGRTNHNFAESVCSMPLIGNLFKPFIL